MVTGNISSELESPQAEEGALFLILFWCGDHEGPAGLGHACLEKPSWYKAKRLYLLWEELL